MSSQIERGTALEMVRTIAFRVGVLERILQRPVVGGLEIRADELAYVQLLQQQIDNLCRYLNLPSAEPERKRGKWEVQLSTGDDRPFIWWKCSVCGQIIYSETERDRREFHAFCGRCGADMRGDR